MRDELERLCEGRESFPMWTEFEALGLRPLRKVVDRYGGARRWAEDLGLRIARPGPAKGHGGQPPDAEAHPAPRRRQTQAARERAELRAHAIALHATGVPAAVIAERLDRHFTTIHRWIRERSR